jgi:hypothetical protein
MKIQSIKNYLRIMPGALPFSYQELDLVPGALPFAYQEIVSA